MRHTTTIRNTAAALAMLCAMCTTATLHAQEEEQWGRQEKEIYIPRDLRKMNLNDTASLWSYSRMALTDNFAIFWQKGFGPDLSCPPDLEGKPMKVDLDNLKKRLEDYYAYFRDSLHWVRKGTLADKFRMMIMINYSLEGTAYGGDYDGVIGALWLAPNRLQDERLNCIAHELGHSFQSQINCDEQGDSWGGSPFFEMTSQWMLWQVNKRWIDDERFHWEAFTHLTHKPFLDIENIYHSPFVIEHWATKRGRQVVAQLFREGRIGEDPAMTYRRMFNLNQEQYLDELFDACRHFINWDYKRIWKETRAYACKWPDAKMIADEASEDKTATTNTWLAIAPEQAPAEGGFNVLSLNIPMNGKVKIQFDGLDCSNIQNTENLATYRSLQGWRYGLVAVDAEGNTHYSKASSASKGTLSYSLPKGKQIKNLFLVVMGAPKDHIPMKFAYGEKQTEMPTFPWRVKII